MNTFRKFSSKEDAEELTALLSEHGIEFELVDDSSSVDSLFTGGSGLEEISVKIDQGDFQRANTILTDHAEKLIDNYSDDHYLYEFTDEELIDILYKFDEWNKEDYLLARRILGERGTELTDDEILEMKELRLNSLRAPIKASPAWVILAFILGLAGGLLGILVGWIYMTLKKTDPEGDRVFVYDEPSRRLGGLIVIISVVSLIFWVVMKVLAN